MTFSARALVLLNLADAARTLYATRAGLASEANPAMRALLEAGPVAFLAAKTLAAPLLVLGLAAGAWHPVARYALRVLCAVYAVVVLYEVALLLP